MLVKKRSESVVNFDMSKIEEAIRKCHNSLISQNIQVPNFDIQKVISNVSTRLEGRVSVDVEEIQDAVELSLIENSYGSMAKAYILYREKRTSFRKGRLPAMPNKVIQEYIHASKYSQYLPEKYRRELYSESVQRSEDMNVRKYPQIEDQIRKAFKLVQDRRVLPSMRSMQFAGKAVEILNERIYNCSYSPCNRLEFFKEAFFLLLCGCGTGYSVQKHHVAMLPPLKTIDDDKVQHFIVPDTIQGWSEAAYELIKSYVDGSGYVEFSYHLIRNKNSLLKTTGGRAPGHVPLKNSLERIRIILNNAQGRHLRPIECHDIICLCADAVIAGGNRRSSCISLFSPDDEEMFMAKTGNWYATNRWRERANNSAVLVRNECTFEEFSRVYDCVKEWGDPGFFFVDDREFGTNPCGEIGLYPLLKVDASHLSYLAQHNISAKIGDTLYGWSFCNLTEVNMALCHTAEEYFEAVEAATIIGTCQAGYTSFPFLGPVTELIARRDALLGVSMTGMMDNPKISFDPDLQRDAALLAIRTNIEYAKRIGINAAARVTTIKPSGTASLALGCLGSGIHAHHAKRYFRRVRASKVEAAYQYFKSINPHMCSTINELEEVIVFCIQAPEGAITRNDLTALEFLEKVFLTKSNWIQYGTARDTGNPGLTHNVSNTITVKDDEWDIVRDNLWENRHMFSGISLLGYYGDKGFNHAPREEITTHVDEMLWNEYVQNYNDVDYSYMVEMEDGTNLQGEMACGAGGCEI